MDGKKKNFLGNLRMKTKFANLKKPGKKALAKQGRNLAHRRSISVPDLSYVPGDGFSTESALVSTASDAIFFGNSPGMSDTDSIASGSTIDGPLFADKLSDSFTETRRKVSTDHTAAALNRISAPVESLALYEEFDDMINSGSENKANLTQEGLYAQVDKRAKGNVPKFTFDPVPAPRSVFANAPPPPPTPTPRPDLAERESLCDEDTAAGTVAGALARAHSLGDQVNPCTERKTASFEQRKPSSENRTPPPIRRNALICDISGTLWENADGISLDSACGTPNEERVTIPWTDSEELDHEVLSPYLVRELSTEEALLEEAEFEEALEEVEEVSFITSVFNYTDSQRFLFLFEVYKYCRLCYLKGNH